MTAQVPFATWASYLGLAKEVTRGTALAPSLWLPVRGPQNDNVLKYLPDRAQRGSMADVYNDIAGPGNGDLSWSGDVFPDTNGHMMMGLLGSAAVQYITRAVDGVSSTTTTITSATAAFVASDVGRSITISGAGAAGALLTSTIVAVGSGTSITIADAATTAGSGATIKISGAIFTDGAGTNGQAVLTSSQAQFTAADVGKPIRVVGAGTAAATLVTTILSVQSATSCTLNTNIVTAVTAATFDVGRTGINTQVIGLLNNSPSTGNQPPSYCVTDNLNAAISRQFAAAQFSEWAAKATSDGMFEYSAKALSNMFVNSGTNTSSAFTTVKPGPAWALTTQLNGSLVVRCQQMAIDVKRNVTAEWTNQGSQNPYRLWGGVLGVTGTMTLMWEDDTDLNNYLNGTPIAVEFRLAQPSTQYQVALHMSSVQYTVGKIMRGKDLIQTEITFEALANTTDAVAGGQSPLTYLSQSAYATVY